jgi:hypothetical protein
MTTTTNMYKVEIPDGNGELWTQLSQDAKINIPGILNILEETSNKKNLTAMKQILTETIAPMIREVK